MPRQIAVFATLLFSLTAATLRADEIAGRVLLPNGKPASGAKVFARQFTVPRDKGTLVTTETRGETDDMGIFRLTVPPIEYTASNRGRSPHLLIDAHGCALYLSLVTRRIKNAPYKDIQLQRDSPLKGLVIGPDKKPVQSVQVAVAYWDIGLMNGSPLNFGDSVSTSQLVATTDAKGSFTLRALSVHLNEDIFRTDSDTAGRITATATIKGRDYTGSDWFALRARSGKPVAPQPLVISLKIAEAPNKAQR
jgi:hypothetical protein